MQRADAPDQGEDYRGWALPQRLELLAFDARLAGVPQALLQALWGVIDRLSWAESPVHVDDHPGASTNDNLTHSRQTHSSI